MGVAYYLVFEREVPNVDFSGKAIAKNFIELGKTAVRLGVKPLEELMSIDEEELEDMLGDELDVPDGLQWFDAREGLQSVAALLAEVRSNGSRFKLGELLIRELEALETQLEQAAAQSIRFRLTMDI